jgi:hypothetical protein
VSQRSGPITVIDVARGMGLEMDKYTATAVGVATRALYKEKYDRVPDIERRTKTNGLGSHGKAVYPEWMREEIEEIIGRHETQKASQGCFFDLWGMPA